MTTDEKLAELRKLQSIIGKPRRPVEFTPRGWGDGELREIASSILIMVGLSQYVVLSVSTFGDDAVLPLILAPSLLTVLVLLAQRVYPIHRYQEGERGFLSMVTSFVVGMAYTLISQFAFGIVLFMALLLLVDLRVALYVVYPVVLIELVKRRGRTNRRSQRGADAPRG
ncbi:MAG: hypothetical protein SynsKO_38990 [Synoicihabitans sp.]